MVFGSDDGHFLEKQPQEVPKPSNIFCPPSSHKNSFQKPHATTSPRGQQKPTVLWVPMHVTLLLKVHGFSFPNLKSHEEF